MILFDRIFRQILTSYVLFQVSALFSGTYKQLNLWESRAYMAIKDHKYEKRIMDEEIGKIMSFIKGKKLI